MNALGRIGLTSLTVLLVACAQAPGASPTPSPSPSPAPSPTPTPSAPAGLAGRQFLSTGITWAGAPYVLVADTRLRLSFDDGRLSANIGCNTIGGNYTLDGNVLRFSGASMTEMGCQPALMAQDQWLVAFLTANPTFAVTDTELKLSTSDTVITLANLVDLPLVGPTWGLNSIISGDVVSSIPVGVNASLTFADNGTFQVNDGCNSGGGRYVVDGDAIHFSDVVMTAMGCAGAAGQVEQAVLAVLNADSITFAIEFGSLTFMDGVAGIQFTALGD